MAKPDDRSDNAEKIQDMIGNTIDNLEESEDYLDEHADEIAPQEQEAIKRNNRNRRQSLKGFRNEIRDESGQSE